MEEPMKRALFVTLLLCGLSVQAQNFKIAFTAYPENVTTALLSKITSWGGTDIQLMLNWWPYQSDSLPISINFASLDQVVAMIMNNSNLSLHFRIMFGQRPAWAITGSNSGDWMIGSDGQPILCTDFNPPQQLNFASPKAVGWMLTFYRAFLAYANSKYSSYRSRIIDITPSVSHDGEMEYPYWAMGGYSSTELSMFQAYLSQKYGSLGALNSAWNASFGSWSAITPRIYNWADTTNSNDLYPNGRIDWLNFRTSILKNFIDSCAAITHGAGFKMVLQLGSIYDNMIENRGWIDPTSLVENVDRVVLGDIFNYKPNFQFGADYLRSICNFWNVTEPSLNRTFATETDWPGYGSNQTGWTVANLCADWTNQLQNYYNKGASLLSVSNWDIYPTDYTPYSGWIATMNQYKTYPVISPISYVRAVHLGCEREAYVHNPFTASGPSGLYRTFDIDTSVKAQPPYTGNAPNYDGQCDIVTDYMLVRNPNYIKRYKAGAFWFTKSSEYISNNAYLALMRIDDSVYMYNATWYSNSGHGQYAFTAGIYNEHNTVRSPIHLVWRTRTDLIQIYPDADYPTDSSGVTRQFVDWAYLYGCGYAGPGAREYPKWEIRDGGSTGTYCYDANIRTIWNQRSDLQTAFPDGYHGTSANMTLWAKCNGYSEDSWLLASYQYWPYIGTGVSVSPSISQKSNIQVTAVPEKPELSNFPNPFNPTTTLKYVIPLDGQVLIKVYDMLGREVATLVNEYKAAGAYEVRFDGSKMGSGVYFYVLRANALVKTGKMILLK
jgi:hypothetical protein